jgi:predicted metal-dependent hydrolase
MMAVTMITAALQQLPLWNEGTADAGWQVRRSRRAQRPSVKVYRDGAVEIVVPERLAAQQIENFVARHRGWIERHRCAPPADLVFPPARLELRALGETWHCRTAASPEGIAAGTGPIVRAHVEGGMLELQSATGVDAVRGALLDWLAERAGATLEPRLKALAAELAVTYRRVQIRRQRTRWGSCSVRGTISLNFCLLFQRPAVVRYLLAHELAHLTHMNHTPRFWELVAHYEPQWRELDRELLRGWKQVPAWVLVALRSRARPRGES